MLSITSAISIASLLSLSKAAHASIPTVSIENGPVIGTTTLVPSATAPVTKYLGIPYASSPPQRFKPPKSPHNWSELRNATRFQPTCIQQFSYPKVFHNREIELYNTPPLEESEDCLYLNIFTQSPCAQYLSATKAVMVYFYGGTLQLGGTQFPEYDGSSFAANQDVVVVTANYRLGPFGFAASPEIPTSEQNVGFLDQRRALEWVQQNIRSFGGDPNKVTVFGESAGALSVLQLIAKPPHPLTFRAAIMQSVPAFASSNPSSWTRLVQQANCSSAASPTVCLRAVSADTIKEIVEQHAITFGPVANNITYVVDAREEITRNQAAQVPIIIGTNSQEGRLQSYLFGYDKPGTNVQEILREIYPAQKSLQNAIMKTYSDDLDNPLRFMGRYYTDISFLCPLAMTTNLSLNTLSKYNMWQYYYNASFPNLLQFPDSGVYHGSEIPIIFGTYPRNSATANEVELSKYMQKAWADFAKDPAKGPGWQRLGFNGTRKLWSIGSANSIRRKTVEHTKVDKVCKIYGELIQPL